MLALGSVLGGSASSGFVLGTMFASCKTCKTMRETASSFV